MTVVKALQMRGTGEVGVLFCLFIWKSPRKELPSMNQVPAPRKGPNLSPKLKTNYDKTILKRQKYGGKGEKHNSGCSPSLVNL